MAARLRCWEALPAPMEHTTPLGSHAANQPAISGAHSSPNGWATASAARREVAMACRNGTVCTVAHAGSNPPRGKVCSTTAWNTGLSAAARSRSRCRRFEQGHVRHARRRHERAGQQQMLNMPPPLLGILTGAKIFVGVLDVYTTQWALPRDPAPRGVRRSK